MRTKEWLKEERVKHSITQSQLAKKIGVSTFAIENIEQGKRMGSADTWDKIEAFFGNGEELKISYDLEDLIDEIRQDIEEFGEDEECYLFYKIVSGGYIIFTNYDFITEEDPLKDDEILEGEKVIKTNLKYALEIFESQNKIL